MYNVTDNEFREGKPMKFFQSAYAKINLFLDITEKHDDGFHEICSIMHTVSLRDSVSVEIFPSVAPKIVIYVRGKYFLPCNNKNLAYRGAEAFMDALCEQFSVRIGINKRIPVAAGLAGGSSDAAAVLKALNKIKGTPFSKEKLCEIGAQLGSDIPYCVLGRTQLCTGRGEKMSYIPFKEKLNIVIAVGNEHVSTAAAYARLDEMYENFTNYEESSREKLEGITKGLREGNVRAIAENMYNIFEDAVLPMCPQARKIKEKMLEMGALGAMMSGSGPSVFGIFESKEKAEEVASALGGNAYAVTTV